MATHEPTGTAVRGDPFILLPHTVTDRDDFVANPELHLLSMYREPERAAAWWWERMSKNPYGSEGLLSLSYHGRELIPVDLWDEVSGIWHALIELVEEFLRAGSAEMLFPDQPVSLLLWATGRTTLFGANGQTSVVDPLDFIPGLLDEAARYFSWVERHVGVGEGESIGRIQSVRAMYESGRHDVVWRGSVPPVAK